MIQLINVNKGYDNHLILEDINLTIENGSVLGLVGPNGAGKSTILRLIAGIIQADAGVVVVNEYDIFDNADVKQCIYYLGDDPYFFNQSNLKEMKEYIKLFYKNFDETYYYQLLIEFGINEREPISSFSKGMKRQASLILAIAARPQILLMDESFDGLDPLMRFKLKQYIVEQLDLKDTIVVISSHSLGELEDICDNVVLVNNRGLQMSGRIENIHASYHKYQIVFQDNTSAQSFATFDYLKLTGSNRIFTLIIKGDKQELDDKIAALNPYIIEHTNLSLEEIYRLEAKGVHQWKICSQPASTFHS